MNVVLNVIAPVFALIAAGAIARQRHLISAAGFRGVNDLVFFAALPALLFISLIDAPPLHAADVAAAFLLSAVAIFALGVAIARTTQRATLTQAAVFGINACYGNTVMLGIPIIGAIYGNEGLGNLLAIIAFHSAVLLPLASLLIEADAPRSGGLAPWRILARVAPATLRNPVVAAILLAFLWRSTGLALPEPLHRFLALVAPSGAPLALFCLGASLPMPTKWQGTGGIALACALKLLAMPALAASIATALGVTGTAFKVVVVTAAMPTGANAFLLARRSATMAEASAGTVVTATLLSIPALAALLHWL